MRARTLIGIGVFLLLALISRWVLVAQRPPAPETTAIINTQLDYDLLDLQMRWYDQDGLSLGLLAAPRISQNAASGIGQVHQPRIQWQTTEKAQYELLAEIAIIEADRSRLNLSGGVTVNEMIDGVDGLTLQAEDLLFDLLKNSLYSKGLVKLAQPGIRYQGTGMEANLDSRHYRLLSQVKGHYETR